MRLFKKALICVALLAAVLLCAAVLPTETQAATEGYYSYNVTYDGEAYIYNVATSISGRVVIPSTLGGYPVTEIYPGAFEGCTGITSITIPDSVTYIGGRAFYNCTGLTSVTIPDSVTNIGGRAFYNCTGITSITIPDSVTSIGDEAFYNCTRLTSVTIPDSVTEIGREAFKNCYQLKEAILPKEIDRLGDSIFSGCTKLESLTLTFNYVYKDSAVVGLGEPFTLGYLFGQEYMIDCVQVMQPEDPSFTYPRYTKYYIPRSLSSVTLSGKGGEVTWHALQNCSMITNITISDDVKYLDRSAFEGCTGIEEITIPYGVKIIQEDLFKNCTNLTTVNFFANNCEIRDPYTGDGIRCSIFAGCEKLTTINVGARVVNIPIGAFSNCYALKKLRVYPGNAVYKSAGNCIIKQVSGEIVAGCKTSIIPNDGSIRSIGEVAFQGCSGLTKITIPDSVTSIGERAFDMCTGLTAVYYMGTEMQKAQMRINDGNDFFENATWSFECGPQYVIGDTDSDGEISDWDGVMLARYLAGWSVEVEVAALDIDGDGEITDWDGVLLDRYLAGWNITIG